MCVYILVMCLVMCCKVEGLSDTYPWAGHFSSVLFCKAHPNLHSMSLGGNISF